MSTQQNVFAVDTQGNPLFWCPGCKEYHKIWVFTKNEVTGAQWKWNGDLVKPTVTPSIHVRPNDKAKTCHSHITNGQIIYCPDCGHDLKGQTVNLPLIDL